MTQTLRKVGIAGVLLIVLGWLFWQSVQSSLSEPYVVSGSLVSDWQLGLRGPMQSGVGVLVFEPSDQLRAELFQQIFNRTMESMTSPAKAAMPIVLPDEYQSIRGTLSIEDLRAAAEDAGLGGRRADPGLCRPYSPPSGTPALLRLVRRTGSRSIPTRTESAWRRCLVRARTLRAGGPSGGVRRQLCQLVAAPGDRCRLPGAARAARPNSRRRRKLPR